MSKKVVYIAGPTKNVKDYWKPFEEAEDIISAMGYVVLTPTRLPWNLDNEKAMSIRLAMIEQADAVYFLPGWSKSTDSVLEMHHCKYFGKPHCVKLSALVDLRGDHA